MTDRFLCIHGHFYQPARENPWLDAVVVQDAAAPYHDWNQRVTAECYARNASSRILDDRNRIVRIVNNYAKISFNIGPTLLRWLARHAPEVYSQILEADRHSSAYNGHGNAIAQAYNHVILPLASQRDRVTQVIWGIRDFERHFRRRPEGMWLPETAVDIQTLEVLAAHGIAFTILAPHQAKRIRKSPDGSWTTITASELDVTVPYRCVLPSGRSIAIFFRDAAISRAIAFEGLLHDGTALAERLVARLAPDAGTARILVVATDGESYGHHHRFGEMALTSALHRIEAAASMRIASLGAYLAAHPPTAGVEIHENTSWSCIHGIERWRADCGCNTGKGRHQRWRGPLREAISWLKGELDGIYERHGGNLFIDHWAARDDAIELIDGPLEAAEMFFTRHSRGAVSADRRTAALRLLEMQRQGLLMQSSDAWFFDDLSGIETVQVLAHAARAIELAEIFGGRLEEPFLQRLRRAEGNLEHYPDGGAVYERLVRPMAVPVERIVAQHAITSLVEPVPEEHSLYAATIRRLDRKEVTSGPHRLVTGRMRVRSTITEEEEDAVCAVVHFGGHNVRCAVRLGWREEQYADFRDTFLQRFGRDLTTEVIRAIDLAFGPAYFTVRDLVLDDRRRVLARLTEQTLIELEGAYRRLYRENHALMEDLRNAQAPIPPALLLAAVFVLARDLRHELALDSLRPLPPKVFELLKELRAWGWEARADRFEPLLRHRLEAALAAQLPLPERLGLASQVLDLAETTGATIDLWEAQNRFYQLVWGTWSGDAVEPMQTIGRRLNFNMDALSQTSINF